MRGLGDWGCCINKYDLTKDQKKGFCIHAHNKPGACCVPLRLKLHNMVHTHG